MAQTLHNTFLLPPGVNDDQSRHGSQSADEIRDWRGWKVHRRAGGAVEPSPDAKGEWCLDPLNLAHIVSSATPAAVIPDVVRLTTRHLFCDSVTPGFWASTATSLPKNLFGRRL